MPALITSLDQLDPHGTYSYADYRSWQFEGWEEILNGKLLAPPAYDDAHQRVCGNLLVGLLPATQALVTTARRWPCQGGPARRPPLRQ